MPPAPNAEEMERQFGADLIGEGGVIDLLHLKSMVVENPDWAKAGAASEF